MRRLVQFILVFFGCYAGLCSAAESVPCYSKALDAELTTFYGDSPKLTVGQSLNFLMSVSQAGQFALVYEDANHVGHWIYPIEGAWRSARIDAGRWQPLPPLGSEIVWRVAPPVGMERAWMLVALEAFPSAERLGIKQTFEELTPSDAFGRLCSYFGARGVPFSVTSVEWTTLDNAKW